MNKIINLTTLIVVLIYATMVTIVIYDLSMSNLSLKGLPYKFEIFTSFAILVLLLGIIRIIRRWQGLKDMKKYNKFAFSGNIAKPAIDYALLFTSIETTFFSFTIIYSISLFELNLNYVLPMAIVLGFLFLESVIFLIRIKRGGVSFRYGIDNNVIAFFTREMHLYFYTGLIRVDLHQSDIINFTYKDGLNLTLPTNILKKEDRIPFRKALVEILESKNIYIDDRLRNWE